MAFRGKPQDADFGKHGWLGNQLIAGAEGVWDGISWDQGDKVSAGIGALWDAAHGIPLDEAYPQRIAHEKARDQYYDQHYPTARTVGEVGGALVPIPGAGPLALAKLATKAGRFAKFAETLEHAARAGERIKQASRLTGRERLAATGAGALWGSGGQLYSDAMTGHFSSPRDYLAAMGGGALQAQLSLRGRPVMAGAGGGAATSVLQDVVNGRPVSLVNAAEAAGAGGAAGKIGDVIGRNRFYYHVPREGPRAWHVVANNNQAKAAMGEQLSKLRTRIAGDRTASTEKRKLPLTGGGHTVPDQLTSIGHYIESKAGLFARLTKRQLQAYLELGSKYRVDHLLPHDIGTLYGFIAAQGGFRLPRYFQQDQSNRSR